MSKSSRLYAQLAPGVALFATNRGLLARTPARWLRIDLHDRARERALVNQLAEQRLSIEDPSAVEALCVLGEHALLGAPAATPQTVTEMSLNVWVGAPDDARLGERVLSAVDDGQPFVVVWIDERGAAIARHDPEVRGCPACAWRTDAHLARYAAVGVTLSSAPRAFGGALVLRAWAQDRISRDDAPIPAGRVVVRDAIAGTERTELVIAHPGCICAVRSAACGLPEDAEWEAFQAARYSPVWPVERARAPRAARVVFRRSRAPWKASSGALGVALAAGPEAEQRALAEAIERYCFLHAAPHGTAFTARSLGSQALDADLLRSLLFRRDEYELTGFRFEPFDLDTPLDWCEATHLESGSSALVPASLVGRAPSGSKQLVDATSNGYAAHHDRDRAVERALLEVIERDAVLCHWYAPLGPLSRIDVDLGLPRSCALLATQDIELPVVLAVGLQKDGALRCGAAADVTIDGALARATRELSVALTGLQPTGTNAESLAAATHRFEPDDHMRWYGGERGLRTFDALMASDALLAVEALRERWPEPASQSAAIRAAIATAGLSAYVVDRSLPAVFGRGWHVVRALVPGTVELSWGTSYRRLAAPRLQARLARGAVLSDTPHPLA